MQSIPVSMLSPSPAATRPRTRTALVASADLSFRKRLSQILIGLRWQVREAEGGAEAWAEAEKFAPEAVIVDSWLPDLELGEFLRDFRGRFPQVDLVTSIVTTEGASELESPRGPYRQELLYALRRSQDSDSAAWNAAPMLPAAPVLPAAPMPQRGQFAAVEQVAGSHLDDARTVANEKQAAAKTLPAQTIPAQTIPVKTIPIRPDTPAATAAAAAERLPELIGNAPGMLEVSRRVRLVAPRMTPVLIEGPTGSGKELVAEALHRLSSRSRKPFVAINCAAIPEALLEAELFGHTRGAFTGAVHGRTGRIEAADGGTLFLDEIGEMPLALQAKLLRFVECGELQRVGDNEKVKVDVRIVAATHRPLAQQAQSGVFRSDLYYRLAVFLIRTPALGEHAQDLPLLVEHFLERLGREMPMKRVDASAMAKLEAHDWPGNVRELEHVLERAVILASDAPVLTSREIDFGFVAN
jgi:DNA-binding NtrC family response regulator